MNVADAIAALKPPAPTPGASGHVYWDVDMAEAALDFLAAQRLSAEEMASLAAALDSAPIARWVRHDELVLKAADCLWSGGHAAVPRFLIVASEASYQGEARAGSFFDEDDGPSTLMERRRDFEARVLERTIVAMRAATPPAQAALFQDALEPPERLQGDSADYMASRLLDHLAEGAPDAFLWLKDAVSAESTDGPYGWAVAGFAQLEVRRERALRDQLTPLLSRQDWNAVLAVASELSTAFPSSYHGHAALCAAYRAEQRYEEAERAAREGFAHVPGSLQIFDAALPAMLHNGRAGAVLALWDEQRPPAAAGVREAPERARALRHLESTPRALHYLLGHVVGNVIVAYCAARREQEGVRDLAAYIETLSSPLMLGNAACLYARASQVTDALLAVERALLAGKPIEFFEQDPDLATLRGLPAFQTLLKAHRATVSVSEADDEIEQEEAPGASADDPGVVAAIKRQLGSQDLTDVREGLAALRTWVRAAGPDPDLSLFGVEPGDEELVPNELFDDIVARHGLALGHDGLLDLTASLFNCNVAYHSTKAAITAARLLVQHGDGSVHEALVDIFQTACTYYDDGHRYHGASGMDLFIDEILSALCGSALAKLMVWAYENNYTQDLGELLVPALEAGLTADEEARVLAAHERTLRDHEGRLYTHELGTAGELVARCLAHADLTASARARLEALQAEATREREAHQRLARGIVSDDPRALEQLLLDIGAGTPAYMVERESHRLVGAIARHYQALDARALLAPLSLFSPASDLFPELLRLATEKAPEEAVALLERLHGASDEREREALKAAVQAANQRDLFASLRRALRSNDVWNAALPSTSHPALNGWLARS